MSGALTRFIFVDVTTGKVMDQYPASGWFPMTELDYRQRLKEKATSQKIFDIRPVMYGRRRIVLVLVGAQ